MSDVKRWSPVLRTDTARGNGYKFAEMELNDIGMWVSISEHGVLKAEVARLKAENERLRKEGDMVASALILFECMSEEEIQKRLKAWADAKESKPSDDDEDNRNRGGFNPIV